MPQTFVQRVDAAVMHMDIGCSRASGRIGFGVPAASPAASRPLVSTSASTPVRFDVRSAYEGGSGDALPRNRGSAMGTGDDRPTVDAGQGNPVCRVASGASGARVPRWQAGRSAACARLACGFDALDASMPHLPPDLSGIDGRACRTGRAPIDRAPPRVALGSDAHVGRMLDPRRSPGRAMPASADTGAMTCVGLAERRQTGSACRTARQSLTRTRADATGREGRGGAHSKPPGSSRTWAALQPLGRT